MRSYKVHLVFTNLDNFMGTNERAEMTVEIKSDDERHADLLAERLVTVYGADHYVLEW